jgi:Resolvase, N terminal domain
MAGRPELALALADLDEGDELVIAEWDRATRSMWDGLQIIKAVIDAKASIRVLDRSYIDLTSPIGRGFMAMLSARAQAHSHAAPADRGTAAACQGRDDARACQELPCERQHDFEAGKVN